MCGSDVLCGTLWECGAVRLVYLGHVGDVLGMRGTSHISILLVSRITYAGIRNNEGATQGGEWEE